MARTKREQSTAGEHAPPALRPRSCLSLASPMPDTRPSAARSAGLARTMPAKRRVVEDHVGRHAVRVAPFRAATRCSASNSFASAPSKPCLHRAFGVARGAALFLAAARRLCRSRMRMTRSLRKMARTASSSPMRERRALVFAFARARLRTADARSRCATRSRADRRRCRRWCAMHIARRAPSPALPSKWLTTRPRPKR